MGDLLAEVSLSSLLHLDENHSADFLRGLRRNVSVPKHTSSRKKDTDKVTLLALVCDGDGGFSAFLTNFERPVLHVTLDILVVHFAANETLSVEHGVFRVGVVGVFGAVTDTNHKYG